MYQYKIKKTNSIWAHEQSVSQQKTLANRLVTPFPTYSTREPALVSKEGKAREKQ
ncbi:hypothetical protein ACTFR8_28465 [Bacillus cereus group sp. MYBK15-3]|uniref:hypothetical protein n=1 Tax=unclassified Bacillus cereus group TaxID=2750818 RepID=UPI003F79EF7B